MRPFRFGLQSYSAESPAQWRDLARQAEDLGFSSFHLADHYIGPGAALEAANHPEQNIAAVPAMMFAADATSTIKIGTTVLCADYHQPNVLAKELATIDFLSEGRLEAGLGAGWIQSEYEAMGIPFDRPGVRIDRLREYVSLMRASWAGEPLDITGDHTHAVGFSALPARDPQPPIMIGGGSPRVLRMAGEIADIVSINFSNKAGKIGPVGVGSGTADGTTDKISWIREGAGDRFDDVELEIAAYFTQVTDQADMVAKAMADMFGLTVDQAMEHPHILVGSVDHIVETLQARRERYGISYVMFGAAALDQVAPVVERLAGT